MMMTTVVNTLTVLLFLICMLTQSSNSASRYSRPGSRYRCGGILNATRGVISTPNFPKAFPVPIECKWLIKAGAGKKIVVYFTQYYLRGGFFASEYQFYNDESLFVGRSDFGELNIETTDIVSLTADKPYLLLRLDITDMDNMNLRVDEYLLDVYGFNITYEVLSWNEPIKKHSCAVFECSYLGDCLVSADYEDFYCRCFPTYYGDQCQYGPACDPKNGITQCYNGGKCRYFYGSTVNICECPNEYEGVQCTERREDYVASECEILGCTDKCLFQDSTGQHECACHPGYKLDYDNATCVEEGVARFFGSFRIDLANVSFIEDSPYYKQLKKEIERLLTDLYADFLREPTNITVIRFRPPGVTVDFHFVGDKSEESTFRSILEFIVTSPRGGLGDFNLNRQYFTFKYEPALNLQRVESGEPNPIAVGSHLTLVCLAKGSSWIEFEWYKDDARISIEKSTRNIWETRLPKNLRGQYTSIFNVDSISILDEGKYTCSVKDWEQKQNKSISIYVVPVPRVVVTPLKMTILEGDPHTVTCISLDDTLDTGKKFTYSWLKDGKPLSSAGGDETAEDHLPTGSWLVISAARESATYTCSVSNKAGIGTKDSIVTVVPSDTVDFCKSEQYEGVTWGKTALNDIDVQDCPSGFSGLFRRRCLSSLTGKPSWDKPSYSACVSKNCWILSKRNNETRPNITAAEGDLLVQLLGEICSYQDRFGSIDGDGPLPYSQIFADIVSNLLESDSSVSERKGLLQLMTTVGDYGKALSARLALNQTFAISSSAFFMEVGRYERETFSYISFPTGRDNSEHSLPDWLLTDVTVSRNHIDEGFLQKEDKNRVQREIVATDNAYFSYDMFGLVSIFFRNLKKFYLLPSLNEMERKIGTPMVALVIDDGRRDRGNDYTITSTLRRKYVDNSERNKTCVIADLSVSDFEWSAAGCKLLERDTRSTVCSCSKHGIYTTFYVMSNQTMDEVKTKETNNVVLAGFTACLGCLIVTVILHVVCLKWLLDQGCTFIVFSRCIVIIIGNLFFSFGLTSINRPGLCIATSMFIHCGFMSAFVFLVVEALHNLLCTLRNTIVNIPTTKLLFSGWGTSIGLGFLVLLITQASGFGNPNYCWLSLTDYRLYIFLAPAGLLLTVYCVLLIVTILELSQEKFSIYTSRGRRAFMLTTKAGCSLITGILLCLLVTFSILYVNYEETKYGVLFATMNALFGFFTLVCHCIVYKDSFAAFWQKKKNKEACKKGLNGMNGSILSNSSFKSFIRAQNGSICEVHEMMLDSQEQKERVRRMRAILYGVGSSRESATSNVTGLSAASDTVFPMQKLIKHSSTSSSLPGSAPEGQNRLSVPRGKMAAELSPPLSHSGSNDSMECEHSRTTFHLGDPPNNREVETSLDVKHKLQILSQKLREDTQAKHRKLFKSDLPSDGDDQERIDDKTAMT